MFFSKLCSRGWSLPVLSALAEGCPARVSPVAARLGAGRTIITDTFVHLQEMGVLDRTSGHGHPLRPEFMLTPLGGPMAHWAQEVFNAVDLDRHGRLLRKSWCLPVMRLLGSEQRYGRLREALVPVTDRALSQSLKALAGSVWVERCVEPTTKPPQVSYRAIGMGAQLVPHLERSFSL